MMQHDFYTYTGFCHLLPCSNMMHSMQSIQKSIRSSVCKSGSPSGSSSIRKSVVFISEFVIETFTY